MITTALITTILLLLIVLMSFIIGYNYGKRVMLELMKIHLLYKDKFGYSIKYEENIMKGKKPWDNNINAE